MGIGSLVDHAGVIEVIDTRGIDVYVHDGVPLVAATLAKSSTATVNQLLPAGTETIDTETIDKEDLAQILTTYLSHLSEEPPLQRVKRAVIAGRSPWCPAFPTRCKKHPHPH